MLRLPRLLLGLVLVTAFFGLGGCGGAPAATEAPSPAEPTEEPAAIPPTEAGFPTEAPVVEPVFPTEAPPDIPEPTQEPVEQTEAPLPTATLRGQGLPEVTPPARLPERRLLSVEWPQRIRMGSSDTIRLTLEMDESGSVTPTAEIGGNEVSAQPVEVSNLYETHTIQVEVELSMAGMNVQPQGLQVEQLRPGQAVTFYWSISPNREGEYRGSLKASLAFIPKEIGSVERYQILARTIEIESVTVLGMSAKTAGLLGSGGSVLGFLFSIPFLESILKRMWGGLRRVPRT